VTRTVVTYLTVAFAFLEGVWLFGPALGLVDDVSRVLAGIVVLGFPLAVVLAWTYDLTPEGIVRTPDDVDDALDSRAPLLRGSAWMLFCGVLVVVGFVFRSMRV
jgi:hypothetical protein